MRQPLVAAIICINILWGVGGGAINLIHDRLGGVVLAAREGIKSDSGVSTLYAAAGAGLFIGMLLARRVGAHLELHKVTAPFIGWTLIAHGLVFALTGLMPTLWLAASVVLVSRVLLGIEFAVQETLMMRLLPDNLRGRVSTTDRAAEVFVTSISTVAAGWSLHAITPQTLAIISGLLSATPGVLWLTLFATGRLRMPQQSESGEGAEDEEQQEETLLASY